MTRHYPELGYRELQNRLRPYKDRGAKLTGDVATLDERLYAFEAAAGVLSSVERTGDDHEDATATAKKTTGVGTRKVSPIKDNSAPLKKGQALLSVLYTYDDFHDITIQCLVVLNACPFLHSAADIEEDEALATSLQPVLPLCEVLAKHTLSMQHNKELESSFTANICKLQEAMLADVNNIIRMYPTCVDEPIVAELFQMFTTDISVQPVGLDAGVEDSEIHADEELELQAAIEQSLIEYRKEQERMLDAHQEVIRAGYEADLAGREDPGDNADEGQGDIPSVEELMAQLPAGGMNFSEVTRTFNIHRHTRETLANFQQMLQPHVHFEGSAIRPKSAEEDAATLPSDDDVREVVAPHGKKGVLFEDLIKILKVRELGIDKAREFRDGILQRRVVQYNENNRMVVVPKEPKTTTSKTPLSKTPARDIFANAPTLTPTPTGVGSDGRDPTKRDSLGSAPPWVGTGTPLLRITTTGLPAQKSPSPGEESSIVSPTRLATSHHRLGAEITRIRDGILAHLRSWASKFPEPTQGAWPHDFSTEEKKSIRKYVASYLQGLQLVGKPDSTDTAVADLLKKLDFPVPKGHHKAALQAVVKEHQNEFARREKAKRTKAKAKASKAGEEEGEEAAVEAPAPKKRRRSSTGVESMAKKARTEEADVEGADEGDDEDDHDMENA